MTYNKEYFEKLDLGLRKKIENSIKEKEGINEINLTSIRDIPNKPINEINNLFLIDYNPVFKCEYTKKNGQHVSYYIKPSIYQFGKLSLYKTPQVNGITAFALIEMSSMGYTVPEFSYFKDLTINMENGEEISFNILITKNTEEILDKKYLESNEEITEISEIEVIDRLLLQHKYGGICDNKTINTKMYKKSNDNKKTIYFDPNIFNIDNLGNSFHFIKLALAKCLAKEQNEENLDENTYYNKNYYEEAEKANFNKLEEYDNNSFEHYLIKFLVDFVKEELINKKNNLAVNEELQIEDIEKDIHNLNKFDELNLKDFLKIARDNDIIRQGNFFNNNDFCDFLIKKRDKLTTKEKNENLLKKAYYYRKNQESLNNILNIEDIKNIDKSLYSIFSNNKRSLDKDLLNVDAKDYQPVILSNIVGKTYGNMSLLNFKQPKGILYFEEIKKNNDFKVKQLYEENENRKLEDVSILISKSKTKIEDIESKENRKKIQNIILENLIELANDNNISLVELSCIILKSINTGDKLLNENEKDICEKFKETMEDKGIYSTKKINDQDIIVFEEAGGLELKNLPKGIIELLIDRKEEFKVKFEKDQKRLNEDLERRDNFIINRVLKEFECKTIDIELNY